MSVGNISPVSEGSPSASRATTLNLPSGKGSASKLTLRSGEVTICESGIGWSDGTNSSRISSLSTIYFLPCLRIKPIRCISSLISTNPSFDRLGNSTFNLEWLYTGLPLLFLLFSVFLTASVKSLYS